MVALRPQENTVAALVSRTGRHLQRYSKGHRQVVGCIPYRYKASKQTPLKDDAQELEVLVISSQKGKGMLFPKGGWEQDESKEEAALRETLEEAGVRGLIGCELGKWSFKSKSHDSLYEGYMFPLLVQEQLDFWPEKNLRQRIWMSVEEAREVCQHWWMKEALDRLVNRLTTQQQKDQDQGPLLESRKENLIARILTSAFGEVLMEISLLLFPLRQKAFRQSTLLWGSNKQEKSHN